MSPAWPTAARRIRSRCRDHEHQAAAMGNVAVHYPADRRRAGEPSPPRVSMDSPEHPVRPTTADQATHPAPDIGTGRMTLHPARNASEALSRRSPPLDQRAAAQAVSYVSTFPGVSAYARRSRERPCCIHFSTSSAHDSQRHPPGRLKPRGTRSWYLLQVTYVRMLVTLSPISRASCSTVRLRDAQRHGRRHSASDFLFSQGCPLSSVERAGPSGRKQQLRV